MAKAELESVDYSHRITKEMAESGKGMVTKHFGGGGGEGGLNRGRVEGGES